MKKPFQRKSKAKKSEDTENKETTSLVNADYNRKKLFKKGVNIIDLLNNQKIFSSKSEIRRAIKNKGIKINNKVIDNDQLIVDLKYFENNSIKISHGKKKHFVVKFI